MKISLHSAENGKIIASSIDRNNQEPTQHESHSLGRRDGLSQRLGLITWLISAVALVLLAICSACALYGLHQLENAMRSKDTTLSTTSQNRFSQQTMTSASTNNGLSEQATRHLDEWHRSLLKSLDEVRSDQASVDDRENDADSFLRIVTSIASHNNPDFRVNDTSEKRMLLIANLTELEARVVSQEFIRLAMLRAIFPSKFSESKRVRREIESTEGKEGKCHFRFSYDSARGRVGRVRVSPAPRGQGMIRVSNTLNDGKSVRQCFFDVVYEPIGDEQSD